MQSEFIACCCDLAIFFAQEFFSQNKDKETTPVITTESLYEEFKKRRQLREEQDFIKKNEDKETINPSIHNNVHIYTMNTRCLSRL